MLDIVLGTRDTIMNKEEERVPASLKLTIGWEIYAGK